MTKLTHQIVLNGIDNMLISYQSLLEIHEELVRSVNHPKKDEVEYLHFLQGELEKIFVYKSIPEDTLQMYKAYISNVAYNISYLSQYSDTDKIVRELNSLLGLLESKYLINMKLYLEIREIYDRLEESAAVYRTQKITSLYESIDTCCSNIEQLLRYFLDVMKTYPFMEEGIITLPDIEYNTEDIKHRIEIIKLNFNYLKAEYDNSSKSVEDYYRYKTNVEKLMYRLNCTKSVVPLGYTDIQLQIDTTYNELSNLFAQVVPEYINEVNELCESSQEIEEVIESSSNDREQLQLDEPINVDDNVSSTSIKQVKSIVWGTNQE